MCKKCYNEYHNEWQKNNKQKVNIYRMNNYNKNMKKLLRTFSKNGKMYIQSESTFKMPIIKEIKRSRYQLIYHEEK